LLDSIFIENHDILRFLFERNPLNDNNNIMAHLIRDFNDTTTSLKISFFNDDLEFEDEKLVPIHDTIVSADSFFLDKYMTSSFHIYIAQGSFYMARVGLDGTLKDKAALPPLPEFVEMPHERIGYYNESPFEYYTIGNDMNNEGDITLVVLDSLFNLQSKTTLSNPPYYASNEITIVYIDDSTYYFSSSYVNFPHSKEACNCQKSAKVSEA
jgi:hypothetical protein